jgi:hypothetical protein
VARGQSRFLRDSIRLFRFRREPTSTPLPVRTLDIFSRGRKQSSCPIPVLAVVYLGISVDDDVEPLFIVEVFLQPTIVVTDQKSSSSFIIAPTRG